MRARWSQPSRPLGIPMDDNTRELLAELGIKAGDLLTVGELRTKLSDALIPRTSRPSTTLPHNIPYPTWKAQADANHALASIALTNIILTNRVTPLPPDSTILYGLVITTDRHQIISDVHVTYTITDHHCTFTK